MIELGQEGKDRITGFTGIVTARHQYVTGCDQYTLSPKMNEKGELGENYSFDEGRIEIIGKGIKAETVSKQRGGPQHPAKSVR